MSDVVNDRDRGDWHTVKDAAGILEVSERTVWRRVKAGKMRIDRSVTPHVVNVSDALTDSVKAEVSEEEARPLSYSELKAEVKRLEEVLAEVRDARDDARRERDDWKAAHAESLRQSQRLLTYVEEEPEEVEEPVEEERLGVLQRFGLWLAGER